LKLIKYFVMTSVYPSEVTCAVNRFNQSIITKYFKMSTVKCTVKFTFVYYEMPSRQG